MSAMVIYLTHHNNTQLRMFPAQFKRTCHNKSYPNLNFITALYKDEAITRQDDDIGFTTWCAESLLPLSIADFFDIISKIKQKNNYENIILCLEANLGAPGAVTTNPIVRECVRLAGTAYVTFFSATPECLDAAKMEYSNSGHMLFESHGFNGIGSHIELIKNLKSSLLCASDSVNLEFVSVGMQNDDHVYGQFIYVGSKEQLEQLSACDQKLSDRANATSVSWPREARKYRQSLILDQEDGNNGLKNTIDARAQHYDLRQNVHERRLSRMSVSELFATSSKKPSLVQNNALFTPPRSKKMVRYILNTDVSLTDSKAVKSAPVIRCCWCYCFFSSTKVHVNMLESNQNTSELSGQSAS